MKQPELAAHLGISVRTLTTIEARAVITNDILSKIAEYLNFDIEFMKELTEDSQLRVINVYEGGKNYEPNSRDESKIFQPDAKNYEPNSTDGSTIVKDNGKNFEPEAKNYEPNSTDGSTTVKDNGKNFEPEAKSIEVNEGGKNFTDSATDQSVNGVPFEKYDELNKQLMTCKDEIHELKLTIAKLQFQLESKQ